MSTQAGDPGLDPAKVQAAMGKVVADLSGGMAALVSVIGLRLGLFEALARGPATAGELAERGGIHARYSLEFLRALRAAGYVTHDAATDRFALPPEHVELFAHPEGPCDLGGMLLWLPEAVALLGPVERAFRDGAGVSGPEFPAGMFAAMERIGAGWIESSLLAWLPADVKAKLERGARVADIGCGAGRALVKLASTFPNSSFIGLDLLEPQLERARANVRAAGLADRIELVRADASTALRGHHDIVTTFDVVHDAPDPLALIAAARRALADDGVYLCLEINARDRHEDNAGPLAAALYVVSIFYCMSTSLACHGEGLGTLGMPHSHLERLCLRAGFGKVERVAEDPFQVLYAVRGA